ncbi:MAG: DUF3341 domain-containing protein [Deltaproteobacteria bacterium]|nr:DUF3341 domain-containing protein [Deltaproteobacteria bacterium]
MSSMTGSAGSKPWGLIAELAGPEELKEAARKVRDAGYTRFDAHSPFPVHGIDPEMGIKPTRLPWIVLLLGLTGLATGMAMQLWTNGVDYPWNISGKPLFSIPASIPIVFELTVLFSAFACFFGVHIANRAGAFYQPMLTSERFRRVTQDGFFLSVEAADPNYREEETVALLRSAGARAIEILTTHEHGPGSRFPRGVVVATLLLIGISIIPLGVAANMRVMTSKQPRIHIVPDMDKQPRYGPQASNIAFPDKSAMRAPPAGTVARGELKSADTHFWAGQVGGQFAATFPKQIEISDATMRRGQERYGIYCGPCHGLNGEGNGIVAQRAAALNEGTWFPPTNLHTEPVRAHPVGKLFDIITHGIRNMKPYGTTIPEADRWAIAMYIRALQRSQMTTMPDLPESERGNLK